MQLLAGEGRCGRHGRLDDVRRPFLVLQLRHVPRHLRPGVEHHLGLAHERHGDEHDQRHVDGRAARRRRSCARPPADAHAVAHRRARLARRLDDDGRRDERRSGSPNRLLYTLGGASPPPPPPPPSGCASLPEQFSGSLSGAGDFDNHPNGTYFYTPRSGTHRGCLDGPSGVDFDLFLRKWNGFTWVTVAQGTSAAPDENVTYNGSAGYYVWRVESYSSSGSYSFGMQRP